MNTSKIVMMRPLSFCSNPETQGSNSFQHTGPSDHAEVLLKAQREFDQFQQVLTEHGIEILKFHERVEQKTPDALFPNNWFCQLPDGRVFIFPMFAPNRRREIRADVVEALRGTSVIDLSHYADKGWFLEGTGSLIFDHEHKLAYACRSPRTSSALLDIFAKLIGYEIVAFESLDKNGQQIYHTNVMMALGQRHVVINMSSIIDPIEQQFLRIKFADTGKTIVDISHEQTLNFAGNMLLLQNKSGEKYWVCSSRAFTSLSSEQKLMLESEATILHSSLATIETYGGGGARCLMGEVW